MMAETVLILGGTGVFGRLITADLMVRTSLNVVVGSRRGIPTTGWLPGSEGRVTSLLLDARDERAIQDAIARSGAAVVVHAAGPYALIGDAPIRAAIARGVPYVDMCPRSDLYASLRARYHGAAVEAGIAAIIGASTAGGLTGILTRYARRHLSQIAWVRASLCVHNFAWGAGVVADYLLSARRTLPHGRVGSSPMRVYFPSLGVRTVTLADSLDYVDTSPEAVRDVAYRIGLPDVMPGLGMRVTGWLAQVGLPLWHAASPFGWLAGMLGGSYTEGGLLHQAFGEGPLGRGTFETHVHRTFGNVRNPSLLCSLAAARLASGDLEGVGVMHPAHWLAPEQLLAEMAARAVVVRSRFLPEGAPFDQPWPDAQEMNGQAAVGGSPVNRHAATRPSDGHEAHIAPGWSRRGGVWHQKQ